jgi:hypothetical protein
MQRTSPYNPWRDLAERFPHVQVHIVDLPDDVLGEIHGSGEVILLRRGTSTAQRRCTLTHELVHLDRGLPDDLTPWQLAREERSVEAEAARRLIPAEALTKALRVAGSDERALAAELWVDLATLRARVAR